LQRPVLALVAASGWREGVKALLAMKKERKLNIDAVDEQVSFSLLSFMPLCSLRFFMVIISGSDGDLLGCRSRTARNLQALIGCRCKSRLLNSGLPSFLFFIPSSISLLSSSLLLSYLFCFIFSSSILPSFVFV
jgi:hypothetical protein